MYYTLKIEIANFVNCCFYGRNMSPLINFTVVYRLDLYLFDLLLYLNHRGDALPKNYTLIVVIPFDAV
jgi:hypothetical protein